MSKDAWWTPMTRMVSWSRGQPCTTVQNGKSVPSADLAAIQYSHVVVQPVPGYNFSSGYRFVESPCDLCWWPHCPSWVTGLQTSESRGYRQTDITRRLYRISVKTFGTPLRHNFGLIMGYFRFILPRHSVIGLKLFCIPLNEKCGRRTILWVV